MSEKQDGKSFWTTAPGVLTGFAALLTAFGGLVTALYAAGLLPSARAPTATLIPPTATGLPPTATLILSIQPTASGTATAQQVIAVTAIPPTAIPTNPCSAPTYFADVWKTHPKLGCSLSHLTSDFTFQTFKSGILVWQKSPSPSTIYAFFNDSRWEKQTDPGGSPNPSCPEAQHTGGLGPVFSFGTLWCNIADWRIRLGVPTGRENDGKNNQIQNFENGTILTVGAAGGFILYSDSHWESF